MSIILSYRIFRRICCGASPAPRPEFSVVCIGLSDVGKSKILAQLCGEDTDDIEPTKGFTIKAVQCPECILNIKEIGGGEKIRPFWKHYYKDAQAVIYVLDSACSEADMDVNRQELQTALSHPALVRLPCLILANCADKPGARSQQQVTELLDLQEICVDRDWIVHASSSQDLQSAKDALVSLSAYLLNKAPCVNETGEFNKI